MKTMRKLALPALIIAAITLAVWLSPISPLSLRPQDSHAQVTCGGMPFIFVDGTIALSAQVNANYTALRNCINNNLSQGTMSVATNALLQGLATTAPTNGIVLRLGYTVAGDTSALPYVASNSACPLGGGNGDGGSQVKSADGKCWLAVFSSTGIDPRWFGADPTGVADSTAAINNALLAAAQPTGSPVQGGRQIVQLPSGIFSVTGITIPGIVTGNNGPYLRGQGMGTVINMAAGHITACPITVGTTTQANSTGQVVISDMQITSAAQQTAGGGICAKGAARLLLKNIYMFDGHMFNGLNIDGADFHTIDHVIVQTPSNAGFLVYDGYDCGFTRTTHTGGTAALGAFTVAIASTTGIVTGMQVFDATRQFPLVGTVQSVNTNISFTMTGATTVQIVSGDTLVFGASCGGTGVTFTGDSISQNGPYGALIGGGIGGVYAQSLHLYGATYGFASDASINSPIPNREIFLEAGFDSDSNINSNILVNPSSLTRLICTGCWAFATAAGQSVYLGLQLPQYFGGSGTAPTAAGAEMQFTGCVAGGSSGANGLEWHDQGTLKITGCDLSHSVVGSGLSLASGGGDAIVVGNMISSNGAFGVSASSPPTDMVLTGNVWKNNTSGGTAGVTAGAHVVCTGNLNGTASGC